MSSSKYSPPTALCDQLLVDFPIRRRPTTVRFASRATVFPIRSTLTMIVNKEELWYSKRDVKTMKLERKSDATTLARTLLAPSAEHLKEGDVHVSQAIGLEKLVNPIQAKKERKIVLYHRMTVLRLQEVIDDEEICHISQSLSSRGSTRAHMLAKAWVILDS
mmetsp:Transcript_3083/g.4740  ORF Transcript_3083/g.4740 Transcript_3083/m.4740 type:complete len:162 (-) Transcript_3083:63-548(-)|eukprot:scaffold23087_cov144-Skeletonema_dohrnii-CCMP3373.AAC.1